MLFAKSQFVGTFKGFNERGLEFAAEIVAPYNADMLDRPQLGQFLLVELGSPDEASLGRITRFVPSGLLATAEGEDYVNTMQKRQQQVPEDLKTARLKYRVQIKLLGAVKYVGGKILYVPSQRRLPHLGAKVALPSSEVLQELCRLSKGETDLGDYVLGEFVYAGAGTLLGDPALRAMSPKLTITFDVHNLVARRSVVFARAGYGKSNLMKYLISELYKTQPVTEDGAPVGTLVFDADGEYFWPDRAKGRPGLCDVPHLRQNLLLFTNRAAPDAYYGGWKAGNVRLDIRQLSPRDVIGVAIAEERQTNQNVQKLRALSPANWTQLVDLVQKDGLAATDQAVGALLGYTGAQIVNSAAEIGAARSNMYNVVRSLHDPSSTVLEGTLAALRRGAVVILDISLLSSAAGNMLAGLLLRRIFNHNQENFTGGAPILPVIAVLEEAQSFLGRRLDESSPFVEWVKEGRKYELGAILITQQPSSIAPELLSQADNWFCFHLLSEGDAKTLGHFNSHYSDDVLAHLIAEPIRGNCFMWSAPLQPFVLPVRIRSFEQLYSTYVVPPGSRAKAVETMTQGIVEAAATRLADRAKVVREALAKGNIKWVRVGKLPSGAEAIGVKAGQVFFVVKELRQPEDTETDDALRDRLMSMIVGEADLHRLDYEGKPYYAATADAWKQALGMEPKVKP
jgi:uncharacterized protein